MMRGYTSTRAGQVHWRMCMPAGEVTAPDLYCLHPAPLSGIAFETIMVHLARGRRVIAPDYPGHGGSDALAGPASIELYAAAMADVAAALSGGAPYDLMGFHTGCLVAMAMARGPVGAMVLVDVPWYDAATRAQKRAALAGELVLTPELGCLEGAWEFGMTRRLPSQPIERCFALFVEQLRHGRAMNAGFGAAFDYDCEAGLSAIARPFTIIATSSALGPPSRAAAAASPYARLVERADIKRSVLDEAAAATAESVLDALDQDR
jgi:pimeloyl-ACP methyl ester carboxylesterase